MSYIEIEYNEHTGWFCNNDLILICDREIFSNDAQSPFMNDNKLQSLSSSNITRTHRRYIPKIDFNDEKLFPCTRRMNNNRNIDEELVSELNSMLACREYVRKQNHFFDRKLFQQAQADQEKKLEEFKKYQEEQNKIERQKRRRQHPSYVSRFDEKRYVSSIRKKLYQFHD